MSCTMPLHGYYLPMVNPATGKNYVRVVGEAEYQKTVNSRVYFPVACGQCMSCKLSNVLDWSVKLMCENFLHDDSIFITLTYDDDHLPPDMSLHKEHAQAFIKRLRRKIDYYYGKDIKIRFYLCGEYGSLTYRPHFHAIIFGWKPNDMELYKSSPIGNLYTSKFIEDCWSYGFCPFGKVNFNTCAYVARYVTKKITGDMAAFVYEEGDIQPEFALMSRRPGIGHDYVTKYLDVLLRDDYIIMNNGFKVPLPKYFDKIIERIAPDRYSEIKEKRLNDGRVNQHNDFLLRGFDNFPEFEKLIKEYEGDMDLVESMFSDEFVKPVKDICVNAKVNLKKRDVV